MPDHLSAEDRGAMVPEIVAVDGPVFVTGNVASWAIVPDLSAEDLAELERLVEQDPAGEWKVTPCSTLDGMAILTTPSYTQILATEFAELIVALRDNAPRLLAMIKEQGERRDSFERGWRDEKARANLEYERAEAEEDRAEQAEAEVGRLRSKFDDALGWLGVSPESTADEIRNAIGDAQASEGKIQQDRWKPRAEQAEAEVERLRAAQRVVALIADRYDEWGSSHDVAEELRAALAGDDSGGAR